MDTSRRIINENNIIAGVNDRGNTKAINIEGIFLNSIDSSETVAIIIDTLTNNENCQVAVTYRTFN